MASSREAEVWGHVTAPAASRAQRVCVALASHGNVHQFAWAVCAAAELVASRCFSSFGQVAGKQSGFQRDRVRLAGSLSHRSGGHPAYQHAQATRCHPAYQHAVVPEFD